MKISSTRNKCTHSSGKGEKPPHTEIHGKLAQNTVVMKDEKIPKTSPSG